MHLSKLDYAFKKALKIQKVDPCCPDCEKDDLSLVFRTKTLLVSRQLTAICTSSNVSHALSNIQSKLKGEWLIDGGDSFAIYLRGIVEAYRACGCEAPRRTLDLIDHSDGHALQLASGGVEFTKEWLLENFRSNQGPRFPVDQSVLTALRSAIQEKVISQIRLLGCRTGCGEGQTILKGLRDLFGDLPILGTTREINHEDFDPSEFSAPGHARASDPPLLVRFQNSPVACS